MFSASAFSCGLLAPIALVLASVTFSNTPFSWEAYPFTVSTRLGIRSYLLFNCTSMSANASFTLLRRFIKRLYRTIVHKETRAAATMMIWIVFILMIILEKTEKEKAALVA